MAVRPWGICQRSGFRYYLDELISDGLYPNILVHPREWEPPERTLDYVPREDEGILENPSPDIDSASHVVSIPAYQSDTGKVLYGFNVSASCGDVNILVS
jgi:hypothetical protein